MTLRPLSPMRPMPTVQPLGPLKPYGTTPTGQPAYPLQPIMPIMPGQQTYSNLYQRGLGDPYKIQSLSDVLFNIGGQKEAVRKEFSYKTAELLNKTYLSRVVVSGVHYIKNQYLVPLFQGNIGQVAYNSLIALGRDVDIVSNPFKGMIVESDSQNISAAMAILGAVIGGTVSVVTGGIGPLSAAAIGAGVSGLTGAIVNDSSKAVEGFLKGTGLSGEGRYYYIFDYDLGNPIIDMAANMLSEIIYDPLNWGAFAYKSMMANPIARATRGTTLNALELLHKADKLMMSAAYYGNPLGATLKGTVAAFRYSKDWVIKNTKEILQQAIESPPNTFEKVEALYGALNRVYSGGETIRKSYPELQFLRGKDSHMIEFTRRLKKYIVNADVPPSSVHETAKDILIKLLKGNVDGIGELDQKTLVGIVEAFGLHFAIPIGVLSNWDVGFAQGWKRVDEFLDFLLDASDIYEMSGEVLIKQIDTFISGFEAFINNQKTIDGLGIKDQRAVNLFREYIGELFKDIKPFLDNHDYEGFIKTFKRWDKKGITSFVDTFERIKPFFNLNNDYGKLIESFEQSDTMSLVSILEALAARYDLTLEEVFKHIPVDPENIITDILPEGALVVPVRSLGKPKGVEELAKITTGVLDKAGGLPEADNVVQYLLSEVFRDTGYKLKDIEVGPLFQLIKPLISEYFTPTSPDLIEFRDLYLGEWNSGGYHAKHFLSNPTLEGLKEEITSTLQVGLPDLPEAELKSLTEKAVATAIGYRTVYEFLSFYKQEGATWELLEEEQKNMTAHLANTVRLSDKDRLVVAQGFINAEGPDSVGAKVFGEELVKLDFIRASGILEEGIATKAAEGDLYQTQIALNYKHVSIVDSIFRSPLGKEFLDLYHKEGFRGEILDIISKEHPGNPSTGHLGEQARALQKGVKATVDLAKLYKQVDDVFRRTEVILPKVKPSVPEVHSIPVQMELDLQIPEVPPSIPKVITNIPGKVRRSIGLKKIISGAQRGADIGGLLSAEELGISTGGYVPKGVKTQVGNRPEYIKRFGVSETSSSGYKDRTMKNVDESDATIAFLIKDSVGTARTIHYAHTKQWHGDISKLSGPSEHKPYLVIKTMDKAQAIKAITDFLYKEHPGVLNIAGNASVEGIDKFVQDVLTTSLKNIAASPIKIIDPSSVAENINRLRKSGLIDKVVTEGEKFHTVAESYLSHFKPLTTVEGAGLELHPELLFNFRKPLGTKGGVLHDNLFSVVSFDLVSQMYPEITITQANNELLNIQTLQYMNDGVPYNQALQQAVKEVYQIDPPEAVQKEVLDYYEKALDRLEFPDVLKTLNWTPKQLDKLQEIDPIVLAMIKEGAVPTLAYGTPYSHLSLTSNFARMDMARAIKDGSPLAYYDSLGQAFYAKVAWEIDKDIKVSPKIKRKYNWDGGAKQVQEEIKDNPPYLAGRIFRKYYGDISKVLPEKKIRNILNILIAERFEYDMPFRETMIKLKGVPIVDSNKYKDDFLGISSERGKNIYGEELAEFARGTKVRWRNDIGEIDSKNREKYITDQINKIPISYNERGFERAKQRSINKYISDYHTKNMDALDELLFFNDTDFRSFLEVAGLYGEDTQGLISLRERIALLYNGSRLDASGNKKTTITFDASKYQLYSLQNKVNSLDFSRTVISLLRYDSTIEELVFYANNGPVTPNSEGRKILNYFMAMDSLNKTKNVVKYPELRIIANNGNHVYSSTAPELPYIGEAEDLMKPIDKVKQFLSSYKDDTTKYFTFSEATNILDISIQGEPKQIIDFLNHIKHLSSVSVFSERKGRTTTNSILKNLFFNDKDVLKTQLGEAYSDTIRRFQKTFKFNPSRIRHMSKKEKYRFEMFLDMLINLSQSGGGTTRKYGLRGYGRSGTIGLDIYKYGPATTFMHAQRSLSLADAREKKHGSELSAYRSYIDFPKLDFKEVPKVTYKGEGKMELTRKEEEQLNRLTSQIKQVLSGRKKEYNSVLYKPYNFRYLESEFNKILAPPTISLAPPEPPKLTENLYAPKEADRKVHQAVMGVTDILMSFRDMTALEASELLTKEFLVKQLGYIHPDVPEEVIAEVADVTMQYVEGRIEDDGNLIEFIDEAFFNTFHDFFSDGVKTLKRVANDPDVQTSFIMHKVADMLRQQGTVITQDLMYSLFSPMIDTAKSLSDADKLLSRMHLFDKNNQNIGAWLQSGGGTLGVTHIENTHRAKYIKSFKEGKRAKDIVLGEQLRNKASRLNRGVRIRNVLDLADWTLGDMSSLKNTLDSQAEVHDVIFGDIKSIENEFGLNILPREIDRYFKKGTGVIRDGHEFESKIRGWGNTSPMNKRSGWDRVGEVVWTQMMNVRPETFANLVYKHTPSGIFLVSNETYYNLPIATHVIQELYEFHGIEIKHLENTVAIVGTKDPSEYSYVKRMSSASPGNSILDDMTPQDVRRLDNLLNMDGVGSPISADQGGMFRINGEAYVRELMRLGLIDEKQGIALASELQGVPGLTFFGALNEQGMSNFFEEGRLPTPVSLLMSTIASNAENKNAAGRLMLSFFSGEVHPSEVFSGTPQEAFATYKKLQRANQTMYVLFMDPKGRLRQYSINSVKDMEKAMVTPGMVAVPHTSYLYLMENLDNYKMNRVAQWIHLELNSFHKAAIFAGSMGFGNYGTLIRNERDTEIRRKVGEMMLFNETHEKLVSQLGYRKEALARYPQLAAYVKQAMDPKDTNRMIQNFLKQLEGFLDPQDEAERLKFLENLSPMERFEFELMMMASQAKIGGSPPDAFLRLDKMDEFTAEVRKHGWGKYKPGIIGQAAQKIWNSPWMQNVMKLYSKIEMYNRIHLFRLAILNGLPLEQTIEMSKLIFTDYRFKEPDVKDLGVVMPFGNFFIHNLHFWAEHAIKNPALFRIIVQLATAGTVDQEERQERKFSDFEKNLALSGNLQIGQDVWMWNPSLFDALGALPGFLTNPEMKMNLIVKNVSAFLKGDMKAIDYPFKKTLKKYQDLVTNTLPRAMSGGKLTAGEMFPDIAWTKNTFAPRPRVNRGYDRSYYSPGVTAYNRMTGYGVSKMGTRYGGRIARSSFHQRKIVLHRGFYNSLYTSTGKSRIGIRTTQKPRPQNLASRIADQNYKFKSPKIKTRFPRIK